MDQLHLEVLQNEDPPYRARKAHDQKIYVSALERGTRDRSPRPGQVEPLLDRVEVKLCPLKNNRGRMKFYRARSIPELCRVTLKPQEAKLIQEGRMEEVQNTHSFDYEIEKPHIVAWKGALEDDYGPHKDSKLCIPNSSVGSKRLGYPERPRSAPPVLFFNYDDELDMPEHAHNKSKSLGTCMNNSIDFDQIDSQETNSDGKVAAPLHESVSSEKQKLAESVDLSFGNDTLSSFGGGEQGDDIGDVDLFNVPNGIRQDTMTGGFTRAHLPRNSSSNRCDGDSFDYDAEDPTKKALSLISTLRSNVKKPDRETFLRSVRETRQSKVFSTSENRSKQPTLEELTSQKVSYRNNVSDKTSPRGSAQKVTRHFSLKDTSEYDANATINSYSAAKPDPIYPTNRLPNHSALKTTRDHKAKQDCLTHPQTESQYIPPPNSNTNTKPSSPFSTMQTSYNPEEMPKSSKHESKMAPSSGVYGTNKKFKSETQIEVHTNLNKNKSSKFSKPRSNSRVTDNMPNSSDNPFVSDDFSPNALSTVNHELVKCNVLMIQEPSIINGNSCHSSTTYQSIANRVSRTNHQEPVLRSTEGLLETNNPIFSDNQPNATTNQACEQLTPGTQNINFKMPKHQLDKTERPETSFVVLPSEVNEQQFLSSKKLTTDLNKNGYHQSTHGLNTVVTSEARYHIPSNQVQTHQLKTLNCEDVTPVHDQNYYQLPKHDISTMVRSETNYHVPSNQVKYNKHKSLVSEGAPPSQDQDYCQVPKGVSNTMVTCETSHLVPSKLVKDDQHTSSNSEEVTPNQNYYEIPKRELNTIVTSETIYRVTSKQVKDNHQKSPYSEEVTPTLDQDFYQVPKRELNMLVSETTYPARSKQVKDFQHMSSYSEEVTPCRDQDYYQVPKRDLNTMITSETSYHVPSIRVKDNPYKSSHSEKVTPSQSHYQVPKSELDTMITSETGYRVPLKQVKNNPHKSLNSEKATHNHDYYHLPRRESNTMVISEASYPVLSKPIENNQPNSPNSEEVTPSQDQDHYLAPKREFNPIITSETTYCVPFKQLKEDLAKSKTNTMVGLEVLGQDEVKYYPHANGKFNNIEGSNKSSHLPSDQFRKNQPKSLICEQVYQEPRRELNKTLTPERYYFVTSKHVEDRQPRSTTTEELVQFVEDDCHQQPIVEVVTKTEKSLDSFAQLLDHTFQDETCKLVERDLDESYYQQPNIEIMLNRIPDRNQGCEYMIVGENHQNESYYQNPNYEVGSGKTIKISQCAQRGQLENTFHTKNAKSKNAKSRTPISDEVEASSQSYQQPNLEGKKMEIFTTNGSIFTNRSSKILSHSKPDEENYQQSNIENKKVGVFPRRDANVYTKGPKELTPKRDEGYYQQPNIEVGRPKYDGITVHRNDSKCGHKISQILTCEGSKGFYQHPNVKVENLEVASKVAKRDFGVIPKNDPSKNPETVAAVSNEEHDRRPIGLKNDALAARKDEQCYQEPTFEPNKGVYEEPLHPAFSSKKCPLDSGNIPEDGEDYKKWLPEVPNEYKTNENYYEIPMDTKGKSTKCPLDGRSFIKRKESWEDSELIKEHVYEQPDFEEDRIYEQYNYETMKPPQRISGKPDQNVNEQFNGYEDFENNSQSTRVTYSGEVDRNTSAVSNRVSKKSEKKEVQTAESPKSLATFFEDDMLPQRPEIEVLKETPPVVYNAEKAQGEEFSQPSVYSKVSQGETSRSKASHVKANYSSTSLGRFSSFNSEASYKQRLTSAWIDQQKMNVKKSVSRDSRLRRTKSVEFDKERPSEDGVDYKLKHSKSESSFGQFSSMYDPFDDSYLEETRLSSNISNNGFLRTPLEEVANYSLEVNLSKQDNLVSESRPTTLTSNLFKEDDVERDDNIPAHEVKSRVRPRSTEVLGFDMTSYTNKTIHTSMDRNIFGQDLVKMRELSSDQRYGVRPKFVDVSGFGTSSYDHDSMPVTMAKNALKENGVQTRKAISNQRSGVCPKSADVSGFDMASYGDEPALKQSKSELSVDQLKEMYGPYEQNFWFSPEPASQYVHQSDSRKFDENEVKHGRSRSEPANQPDMLNNRGKVETSETEIRRAKLEKMKPEHAKNLTKMDSSPTLVLNVVDVGKERVVKNPKLQRNVFSKSTSNLVSVKASKIEDNRRHSTRVVNHEKIADQIVDNAKDDNIPNDKPVTKLRARYVVGGQRSRVKYLPKYTDEITPNYNDTIKKENLAQFQEQPHEKSVKALKKEGGFRNLFGKIRRSKSEPNLDKDFDILDIDTDHAERKKKITKMTEDEKNSQENSQDKSQGSSKSGLRASLFYPKLKNFKKNFSRTKQSKIDRSFKGIGGDSGHDMSTSDKNQQIAVLSETDSGRENVESAETEAFVFLPEVVDAPLSQSITSGKVYHSESSKSKLPERMAQSDHSKEQEINPTLRESSVTSPGSGRRSFFLDRNQVNLVAVREVKSEINMQGKENITISGIRHDQVISRESTDINSSFADNSTKKENLNSRTLKSTFEDKSVETETMAKSKVSRMEDKHTNEDSPRVEKKSIPKDSIQSMEKCKKNKKSNQSSNEKIDKQKNDYGTKIKGFITKVLPEKGKNVKAARAKAVINELNRSSDENNNSTAVSVTSFSIDEINESEQRKGISSKIAAQSRRTNFVVKHIGESDNERTGSSSEEKYQVKRGADELDLGISDVNERRNSYILKVDCTGKKQSRFIGHNITGQENSEINGKMNSPVVLSTKNTPKDSRDKTTTKTEASERSNGEKKKSSSKPDLNEKVEKVHVSAEEVSLNETISSRKDVFSNKKRTTSKKSNESECPETVKQIKGYTIKRSKTSSIVLSKSNMDNLDTVGKDEDNKTQENLKNTELGTKQEYSRNSKTQTTNDTTLVDVDKGHGGSSQLAAVSKTENELTHATTSFMNNHDDKEKELQYVEKIMVSVHRDASDVIKSPVKTTENFNLPSRDVQSLPAFTPSQHVQPGSSENNDNFVTAKSSEQTSIPVSTPFQYSKRSSGKKNGKMGWNTQDTKAVCSDYARDYGKPTSKREESRVLNENGNKDWGHVVKELLGKNAVESTQTFSGEKIKNKGSSDDLQQFIEELAYLENTPKQLQLKDMSTPIEDDETESPHGPSFRSHCNNTANASNGTHAINKSLEAVDGQWFEKRMNVEEVTQPGTYKNLTNSIGNRSSTSDGLVLSTRQQNGAVVSSRLCRPKSLMNKETNKNVFVINSQGNNQLNGSAGLFSIEKRKEARDEKEVNNASFVSKQLVQKSKPPPVLPKPKRNKGKEISSSKVASTEKREAFNTVAMKQNGCKSMTTSETFQQWTTRNNPSENLRQIGSSKEMTVSPRIRRRTKATAASETSEDLSVRLQRLLCEDDSISEPEDSSITHESSSAIYSFSEGSEFDTSHMDRGYKPLETPQRAHAIAKIPRRFHTPSNDPSDGETFVYAKNFKTL